MGQGVTLRKLSSIRPRASLSDNLTKLQAAMKKMPQVDTPTTHTFGPGVYIREMLLRADTTAVGYHHRFEHTVILTEGSILILQDDGNSVAIEAPATFIGKPGKKTVYAVTDSRVLNIYATTVTDLKVLEETLIIKDVEYDQSVLSILNTEAGEHEIPFGTYKVQSIKLRDGSVGVVATAPITMGEIILPVVLNNKLTDIGSSVRTSIEPTAIFTKQSNGDVHLTARRDLEGSKGGLYGDEITVSHMPNLKGALKCLGDG